MILGCFCCRRQTINLLTNKLMHHLIIPILVFILNILLFLLVMNPMDNSDIGREKDNFWILIRPVSTKVEC